MDPIKQMRKYVKQYIDSADEKVVKMVHAMLEADAENKWWDEMPDKICADVEVSLAEAEKGELIPHEAIKKRYSKWLTK
jgi:predicted transcriptional regulator